jgi:hypothetical protein
MNASENNSKKILNDFYNSFRSVSIKDLEDAILGTDDLDERGFYRKILNLKLQTEQEKIIGERLI